MITNARPINTGELLKRLNISKNQLKYLFESRKLKAEEFETLPNGHRLYYPKDIEKVQNALSQVRIYN